MFRPLLIIIIVLCCLTKAKAQNQANEINLIQPDLTKIERFTFEKVNELREEIALPDLIWDDVLYRAAKDHAQFLLSAEKLSHFQDIPAKKTPYERVRIHGGLLYTTVGENIVDILLGVESSFRGKKMSTVTYSSSAHIMAASWKQSSGHYKNIISEKFNCSALASSYDSSTQRLITVQVFAYSPSPGSIAEQPDYSEYILNLSPPKLPFALKEYRYAKKEQKAVKGFLDLKVDRGYLTGSFKKAKRIFKGRRSGIAQEFIPLRQYNSFSSAFIMVPNRRNGLYELNGALSKPIYRRRLLKYSRRNSDRDYYSFRIFRKIVTLPIKKPTTTFIYPLYTNDYGVEVNLFFVNKKRLLVHRSYMMVPGELFDYPFPEIHFTNSFKPLPHSAKSRIISRFDTVQFQLHYAAGDVNIPEEAEAEVEQLISGNSGKIVSIEAEAYASIEGAKSENDQLAKNRLDHFISLIRPMLDSVFVPTKLSSNEQWKLFAKQIEGTHLHPLKSMKKEEVRKFVNRNVKDTVLFKLLDAQRYTMMKLVFRQDFKQYDPVKSVEHIYDSLKVEFDKHEKPPQALVNALEKAQCALYYKLSQTNGPKYNIPVVPRSARYPVFQYHDLIYRYTILGEIDDKEFYKELHELGRSRYFPADLKDQLIYNNQILIYRKFFDGGKLSDLLNLNKLWYYKYRNSEFNLRKYKKINCDEMPMTASDVLYNVVTQIPGIIKLSQREGIDEFPVEELWKFYYLYTIRSLFDEIPLSKEINRMLPGFKKHFHPNDALLSVEDRLKLAYFYGALQKYRTSRDLIEPIAIIPEPNRKGLKLYLTLKYDDFPNGHEFAEYLISQFDNLGKNEWCDLWYNPHYLNFLLLEDLKLKNFYNCKCNK